jgi:hypothetical protein
MQDLAWMLLLDNGHADLNPTMARVRALRPLLPASYEKRLFHDINIIKSVLQIQIVFMILS